MSDSPITPLRINRTAPPRTRWLKWLVGGLVAAGVVVAAGMAILHQPLEVETVTVTSAYPYQGVTLLNATGYVVAQRKAAVGSKGNGRLVWLGVREGSVVKAGDVLARLESDDVRAQSSQAQANLGVAQANLGQAQAELRDAERAQRRAHELAQRKFISPSAVDEADARVAKARAAVASGEAAMRAAEAGARVTEVSVSQTDIRAPFDGVVLTKNANVGDVITAYSSSADSKGAVVSMADMSTLEVEADISESALAKVHVGQPCEIQLDAFPDLRFQGEVGRIVPTVDRSKASVMTKIRFLARDPRILPEMSAKVALLAQAMRPDQRTLRTVVHKDALVRAADGVSVWRVKDGHAQRIAVQAGTAIGDLVEVSGVQRGDTLVRQPPARLREGAAVKTAQK